jgi:hypothetical protein
MMAPAFLLFQPASHEKKPKNIWNIFLLHLLLLLRGEGQKDEKPIEVHPALPHVNTICLFSKQ